MVIICKSKQKKVTKHEHPKPNQSCQRPTEQKLKKKKALESRRANLHSQKDCNGAALFNELSHAQSLTKGLKLG